MVVFHPQALTASTVHKTQVANISINYKIEKRETLRYTVNINRYIYILQWTLNNMILKYKLCVCVWVRVENSLISQAQSALLIVSTWNNNLCILTGQLTSALLTILILFINLLAYQLHWINGSYICLTMRQYMGFHNHYNIYYIIW